MKSSIEQQSVNTIKTLSMDAVQKAKSGHPGMPMGCADLGYILWTEFLSITPQDPAWINRDRFVLSAGHGSMWIYSLLHLCGFSVSLDDIKNFRQLGSKTPGHPEVGHTEGVECTTGPLGQGTGNAVGMALAAKMMAERFNTSEYPLIDHNVVALVSDGDLMEGISSETCSLAGHLGLSNLIFVYDDNRITIDGDTSLAFTENIEKRFEAHGWFVQTIDGHNHDEIRKAMKEAKNENQRPSIVIAKTTIGQGSPNKSGKASSHGAPLGEDEVSLTKEGIGWENREPFFIPEEVKEHFQTKIAHAEEKRKAWQNMYSKWEKENPEKATEWKRLWNKEVPTDLFEQLQKNLPSMPNATRAVSSEIQQHIADIVPSLTGGSADLASSCKTTIKDSSAVSSKDFSGRNIHFGIREHAMGSIMNGMSLYGTWIPYGSTFLVFSDYVRPSIRLAALSKIQSLFVFTHDSIHVGEDGPTHQPVEHIPSLRLIPDLHVIRPCDALETVAAWAMALEYKDGPSAMILSRQKLEAVERSPSFDPDVIAKGGYVLKEASSEASVVIISTGSEIGIACEVQKQLESAGTSARVVSMPCVEVFEKQSADYKKSVLPDGAKKCVIEATQGDLWYKWIGSDGLVIGMTSFGASGPASDVAKHFGFTPDDIVQKIKEWL